MKVTIAYPVSSKLGILHVHRAGCADLTRGRKYVQAQSWTIDAADRLAVVTATYQDQIEENEPGSPWSKPESYLNDFHFEACCSDLPTAAPTTRTTRKTNTKEITMKATPKTTTRTTAPTKVAKAAKATATTTRTAPVKGKRPTAKPVAKSTTTKPVAKTTAAKTTAKPVTTGRPAPMSQAAALKLAKQILKANPGWSRWKIIVEMRAQGHVVSWKPLFASFDELGIAGSHTAKPVAKSTKRTAR